MSGLAGRCSTEPLEAGRPWLDRAAALLRHRPEHHVFGWAEEPLALRYCSVQEQADRLDTAAAHGCQLMVVGEYFNVEALAARYGLRTASTGRAEILLALYLAHGLAPLEGLNGIGTVGVWDGRQGQWQLITDRLGMRKLYYALVPGAVLFASELKALLADPRVSRAVDVHAVAQLLSFGYVPGERTLYPAIRSLRGGSVLTYALRSHQLSVRRYWEPRYATAGNRDSLEACADELAWRLHTAVRRNLDGSRRIGIPLSGGLDSRALLGFACDLRPAEELPTFSVGHRHTYDVVFAQRMAGVCGTRHRFLALEPDYIARRGRAFAWLTDGMVNVHHGWQMGLLDVLPAACDRVLLGFIGGVLTGYPYQMKSIWQEEERALEDAFVRFSRHACSEEQLAALLRPGAYRQVQGQVEEELRQCHRTAVADEPVDRNRVVSLLHNQQREMSFFLSMYGSALPVGTPFTDNDVIDYLLTIPVRYRLEKQLHTQLVLRHLPRLARVPSDKTGLPLDAAPARLAQHRRWRRLLTEQLPRWSGGGYRPHDRRAYAHYNEWLRQPAMRTFLTETFRSGWRHLEPWCDRTAVDELLTQHFTGSQSAYRQISALLTLLLWFEQADRIDVSADGQAIAARTARAGAA